MGENSAGGSSGCLSDVIVTIIVLVVLILIFKYVWQGVTWSFWKYVELLRVH